MNIKEEVKQFIQMKETPGSLLLTGEWGCGKSHLIRSIAAEYDKAEDSQYIIRIISLFGIQSIQDLEQRVKSSLLQVYTNHNDESSGVFGKVTKGIQKIADAIGEVHPIGKAASSVFSINLIDFIEPNEEIKGKKLVLVFDDLERCSTIDLISILGRINDYCENRRIKTIIVAAEEKIAETDDDRKKYKTYKEKIVCRTVKMTTDYSQLVDIIIETYQETTTGYQNFLKTNADFIKLVFVESKTQNIRVLKYIIADFERIFKLWTESAVPQENMAYVLYTFAALYFKHLEVKDAQSDEEITNHRLVFGQPMQDEKYSLFKSHNSEIWGLKDWIETGNWDPDIILESLKRHYSPDVVDPLSGFLFADFWDMNQDQIDHGLPQAVELAYQGSLTCDAILTLIQKVHYLKKWNVALPCEVDYGRIYQGMLSRLESIQEGEVKEPHKTTFAPDDSIDEEAREINILVERFSTLIIGIKNRNVLLEYLKHPDETSIRNVFSLCFIEIDDVLYNAILMCFSSSPNRIKRELGMAIGQAYFNDERFSTTTQMDGTISQLRKLSDELSTIAATEQDSISKLILQHVCTTIAEQIEKIRSKISELEKSNIATSQER